MGNKNRRTIAGMISCMDEAIGNITKALKDSGLYDKSVILFSSGNCSNKNWLLFERTGCFEVAINNFPQFQLSL